MPLLHLLAGSNGAGKSTYARDVLIPATGLPFINADEIALERWPDAQAENAYEAARIAETQRRERIAQHPEISYLPRTLMFLGFCDVEEVAAPPRPATSNELIVERHRKKTTIVTSNSLSG